MTVMRSGKAREAQYASAVGPASTCPMLTIHATITMPWGCDEQVVLGLLVGDSRCEPPGGLGHALPAHVPGVRLAADPRSAPLPGLVVEGLSGALHLAEARVDQRLPSGRHP